MIIIKIILLILLGVIFYQDYKERLVYWFLFPLVALCSGFLFYNNTLPELFVASVVLNLMFVSVLLLVVFMYSKLILKVRLKDVFGLGDMLLFLSIIFSFSTVSFLVILVFALFFSLVIHLLLKKHSALKTVPLAGYLSLFFGLSYLTFWMGLTESLYVL
jgi:hypothetical protein